ncbi:response regulator [Novosphingobium pentaromativorans]|jgi:FixJ family two-component response regulator|uniref:Response regulator receiver protein n=1 Tax=Novosphingobium pentaromativorans US6-1 TaxID=1088721 RepID=G6EK82_9SPHN|nr:response regulator [Novosphingobium pentaromativorans]AIT82447.1 regulator [Novosphingobium pentaromativorans US6-1]EHJ58300.1 response regulator receiver protein [Novosphingobium pentaromativorans US6-1]
MNALLPILDATRPVIMLVEDDPGVRRSIQLLLQAKGYDVRSYASSKALLADPLALAAACLVTDYLMPEIDGIGVLQALRNNGWKGPAVLVSAYHSPRLVDQAMREGFSRVIEKPLREHSLADTVARLVDY